MQAIQPLPPLPQSGLGRPCTVRTALSLIIIEQRGTLRPLDLMGRIFLAVARLKVDVLLISQSSCDGNFCFVIPQEKTQSVLSALNDELQLELARHARVRLCVVDDVILLTATNHVRSPLTHAATICGTLAEHAVNILAVTQGAASISLVIEAANAVKAIDAIKRLDQHIVGN